MELYKHRDWLEDQYIDKKKSIEQMAKENKCGHSTIFYWLVKFKIPRRTLSEAIHLARANHCDLTLELLEIINGQLLGDASLLAQNTLSAYMSWCQKHKKYVQYIKSSLVGLGINGGETHEYKKISYYFQTYNYLELFPLRQKWYPNGKKIVPRDIKLTPPVCLHWYLGDGCLHNRKSTRGHIVLSTDGFPIEDVEFLIEKLNNLGFKTTRRSSNNTIGISTESTLKFLEYIGPCPVKCYKYKWNYQDNRKFSGGINESSTLQNNNSRICHGRHAWFW